MHWIDYIPILTTLFSIYFLYQIIPHYRMRRTPYLLWWAIGVLTFGLGTLAESVHAMIGWNQYNLRIWYIVGALLGGFPLAQGSVYLLMSKRMADASAWFFSILIVVAAAFVIISPINLLQTLMDN